MATDGLSLVATHEVGPPWGMVSSRSGDLADVISADFDGDGVDEILAAWAGIDSSIVLYYAKVNPTDFSFYDVQQHYLDDLGFPKRFVIDEFEIFSLVELELAQFDKDAAFEFVLTYWAEGENPEEGPIQIIAFDFNQSDNMEILGSISDQKLSPNIEDASGNLRRSSKFELHAGDFNSDEIDELGLIHIVPYTATNSSSIGFEMVGTVYQLNDSGLLRTGGTGETILGVSGNSNDYIERMAADAGDYNGDGKDEIVLMISRGRLNESYSEYYRYAMVVSDDLSIMQMASDEFVSSTRGSSGRALSITTIDMNLDGKEEFIQDVRNRILVRGFDENYEEVSYASVTHNGWENTDNNGNTIVVTDVDILESDSLHLEVIHLESTQLKIWQNTKNVVNTNDQDGIFFGSGINDFITAIEHEAILVASGDLDGDAIRLGTPSRQRVTDIVQPLVILNAPPIHFDVIDGEVYDINECYNDVAPCGHRAIYQTANSTELNLSSQVTVDYGYSQSIEAEVGGSVGPISGSLYGKLEAAYGEGFSRRQDLSRTVRVSITSDAIEDNRVYATISDYDILEYPVFANNELQGYVAVVIPDVVGLTNLENTWLGSKSGLASDYLNQHEVGNILSYPSRAQIPEGATIFGSGGFAGGGSDTWELSNSSTQNWELSFSSESISERTKTSSQSLKATTSLEVAGNFDFISARMKATISGEYNVNQLTTHTTTVRQESALRVEFGTIDGSILGSKTYTVSPFVYWGSGGALTLDYAVQPDVSAGVPSWWEVNYGSEPDLTMILPWKYDQEKGLGSSNPELQSQQTRDILFFPEKPKRGDLTSIYARIQNFSLTDQLSPFTVAFYMGDPANGGELITNENGVSQIQIDGLASRESVVVELSDWLVPTTATSSTFIYAVIDKDNTVAEVHEDNNTGWVLLNQELPRSVSTPEDLSQNLPSSIKLSQKYPNPFNPITTIAFELPEASPVRLQVYNLSGQLVGTLVNGVRQAGSHRIQFDASALPSGLYLYQLQTPQGSLVRKMMVLK